MEQGCINVSNLTNICHGTSTTLTDTYVSAMINNPKINPATPMPILTKIVITPVFLWIKLHQRCNPRQKPKCYQMLHQHHNHTIYQIFYKYSTNICSKYSTNTSVLPTNQLTANPQPQTDTTTTARLPTLSSIEKKTLSPDKQQLVLYWRGQVNFQGKMKKRYNLYPNQLYQVTINPKELEKYFDKIE